MATDNGGAKGAQTDPNSLQGALERITSLENRPLGGTSDVELRGITDNQSLFWDAETTQWLPRTDCDATSTFIGDLTDVDVTTTAPVVNQLLGFDGEYWIPMTVTGGGGTPDLSGYVTTVTFNSTIGAIRQVPTGGSTGQVLTKDNDLDGVYSWQTITVPDPTDLTGYATQAWVTSQAYATTVSLNAAIAALRVLPSGGITGQIPRIAADGNTIEWHSFAEGDNLPSTDGHIGEVLTVQQDGSADWSPVEDVEITDGDILTKLNMNDGSTKIEDVLLNDNIVRTPTLNDLVTHGSADIADIPSRTITLQGTGQGATPRVVTDFAVSLPSTTNVGVSIFSFDLQISNVGSRSTPVTHYVTIRQGAVNILNRYEVVSDLGDPVNVPLNLTLADRTDLFVHIESEHIQFLAIGDSVSCNIDFDNPRVFFKGVAYDSIEALIKSNLPHGAFVSPEAVAQIAALANTNHQDVQNIQHKTDFFNVVRVAQTPTDISFLVGQGLVDTWTAPSSGTVGIGIPSTLIPDAHDPSLNLFQIKRNNVAIDTPDLGGSTLVNGVSYFIYYVNNAEDDVITVEQHLSVETLDVLRDIETLKKTVQAHSDILGKPGFRVVEGSSVTEDEVESIDATEWNQYASDSGGVYAELYSQIPSGSRASRLRTTSGAIFEMPALTASSPQSVINYRNEDLVRFNSTTNKLSVRREIPASEAVTQPQTTFLQTSVGEGVGGTFIELPLGELRSGVYVAEDTTLSLTRNVPTTPTTVTFTAYLIINGRQAPTASFNINSGNTNFTNLDMPGEHGFNPGVRLKARRLGNDIEVEVERTGQQSNQAVNGGSLYFHASYTQTVTITPAVPMSVVYDDIDDINPLQPYAIGIDLADFSGDATVVTPSRAIGTDWSATGPDTIDKDVSIHDNNDERFRHFYLPTTHNLVTPDKIAHINGLVAAGNEFGGLYDDNFTENDIWNINTQIMAKNASGQSILLGAGGDVEVTPETRTTIISKLNTTGTSRLNYNSLPTDLATDSDVANIRQVPAGGNNDQVVAKTSQGYDWKDIDDIVTVDLSNIRQVPSTDGVADGFVVTKTSTGYAWQAAGTSSAGNDGRYRVYAYRTVTAGSIPSTPNVAYTNGVLSITTGWTLSQTSIFDPSQDYYQSSWVYDPNTQTIVSAVNAPVRLNGATGAQGPAGPAGADSTVPGPAGQGVPVGGTSGQVLAKSSNTDYATHWIDAPTGGGNGNPGQDGQNGVGYEFIYNRTASSTSPTSPNNSWGYKLFSQSSTDYSNVSLPITLPTTSQKLGSAILNNGNIVIAQSNPSDLNGDKQLITISQVGSLISTIDLPDSTRVEDIAIDGEERLIVLNNTGNNITVRNLSDGSIINTVALSSGAWDGVTVLPNGKYAVSEHTFSPNSKVIKIINQTSGAVEQTIDIVDDGGTFEAEGLASLPNGDFVTIDHTTTQAHNIHIRDAVSGDITQTITSPPDTTEYNYPSVFNDGRIFILSENNDVAYIVGSVGSSVDYMGWQTTIPTLDATNSYLWVSKRSISGTPSDGDEITGLWDTPVVFSHFGRDGMDSGSSSSPETPATILAKLNQNDGSVDILETLIPSTIARDSEVQSAIQGITGSLSQLRTVTEGGTSGQVLTSDGTNYSWQNAAGGGTTPGSGTRNPYYYNEAFVQPPVVNSGNTVEVQGIRFTVAPQYEGGQFAYTFTSSSSTDIRANGNNVSFLFWANSGLPTQQQIVEYITGSSNTSGIITDAEIVTPQAGGVSGTGRNIDTTAVIGAGPLRKQGTVWLADRLGEIDLSTPMRTNSSYTIVMTPDNTTVPGRILPNIPFKTEYAGALILDVLGAGSTDYLRITSKFVHFAGLPHEFTDERVAAVRLDSGGQISVPMAEFNAPNVTLSEEQAQLTNHADQIPIRIELEFELFAEADHRSPKTASASLDLDLRFSDVEVSFTQLDNLNGTDGQDGEGVPEGGASGQVLAKTSDDDYATAWIDAATGGNADNGLPTGGIANQVLIKTNSNDFESHWGHVDLSGYVTTGSLNITLQDYVTGESLATTLDTRFNTVSQVPDTSGHGEGQLLTVQSDGSYDWEAPHADASITTSAVLTAIGDGTEISSQYIPSDYVTHTSIDTTINTLVDNRIQGIRQVPDGGTDGQVLTHETIGYAWRDLPAGSGGGTTSLEGLTDVSVYRTDSVITVPGTGSGVVETVSVNNWSLAFNNSHPSATPENFGVPLLVDSADTPIVDSSSLVGRNILRSRISTTFDNANFIFQRRVQTSSDHAIFGQPSIGSHITVSNGVSTGTYEVTGDPIVVEFHFTSSSSNIDSWRYYPIRKISSDGEFFNPTDNLNLTVLTSTGTAPTSVRVDGLEEGDTIRYNSQLQKFINAPFSGSRGRERAFAFLTLTHGSDAPSAPTVTYSDGVPSLSGGWTTEYPTSRTPALNDYWETFWLYDPGTDSVVGGIAEPFKADADAGATGPIGPTGERGLPGASGRYRVSLYKAISNSDPAPTTHITGSVNHDTGVVSATGWSTTIPTGVDLSTMAIWEVFFTIIPGFEPAQQNTSISSNPFRITGLAGQDGSGTTETASTILTKLNENDGTSDINSNLIADNIKVPSGGSAGQVLSKVDATEGNTQWIDAASGGGGAWSMVESLTVNKNNDNAQGAGYYFNTVVEAGKEYQIIMINPDGDATMSSVYTGDKLREIFSVSGNTATPSTQASLFSAPFTFSSTDASAFFYSTTRPGSGGSSGVNMFSGQVMADRGFNFGSGDRINSYKITVGLPYVGGRGDWSVEIWRRG